MQIINKLPEEIMATPAAQTHLTPEEYITFERKAIPEVPPKRLCFSGNAIPQSTLRSKLRLP